MAGKKSVGTALTGKISGVKSYLVAVPVKKDGKVVGGLETTPYLATFSRTLTIELGLDSSHVFYALDVSGNVAISSDISQLTTDNPDLSGNVEWQTSLLTGWRFALGYPEAK